MKNYKHVSKSNNAMKLAAVASAAVMLAPLAMNSVSSFAAGKFTMADSQKQDRSVWYPEYTTFATVDSAVAANQNGTNGQANSGSQEGATVGFNVNDLQNIIDSIKALNVNNNADSYKSQASQLSTQFTNLQAAAFKAQKDVSNSGTSAFSQLSANDQLAADQTMADAKSQLAGLNTQALAAQKTYEDADGAAVKAPTDATKVAVANQAAQNLKDAMTKFQSLADLLGQVNTVLARKTNNGSVYEAAQAAGKAIANVPAGAQRDAFTARLSQIQATYAIVTKLSVGNGGAAIKDLPANAKTIDAAAAKAVTDLNALAGDAFKVAPTKANGANGLLGTVKINYNKNYGIQIWTAAGKAVRFNKDEVAKGYTLFGKPVKVGDAKKLQGQKNFKVFAVNGSSTVQMNGTTYYNLGGDQYIDAAYTTFTAAN